MVSTRSGRSYTKPDSESDTDSTASVNRVLLDTIEESPFTATSRAMAGASRVTESQLENVDLPFDINEYIGEDGTVDHEQVIAKLVDDPGIEVSKKFADLFKPFAPRGFRFNTRAGTRGRPRTSPDIPIPPNDPIAEQTRMTDETPAIPKKRFKWAFGSEPLAADELNKRAPDGTLLPLDVVPPLPDGMGTGADKDGYIFDEYVDDDLIKTYEGLLAINGQPFYDAEMNALGSLDPSLWYLIPSTPTLAVAPLKAVGKGNLVFNVDMAACAGVYHLARNQLKDKSDEVKMKWATLRLEMYKAGWFANQKMVRRENLPKGYTKTLTRDWDKISDYVPVAWKLCSFVPFMIEHSFRSYGVGYTMSSKGEFIARAGKLAKSSQMDDILNYLDADTLYGQAFRWIGVKRPRDVLKEQIKEHTIPNVFRVRVTAAPAGQALITTTYAVLQSLTSANWWFSIKEAGKYEDTRIGIVNAKIVADPCKYHILSMAYGCEALSADEVKEIEEAKSQAIMVAPLLQAYCDTIVVDSDMGRVKALRKYADSNKALFLKAKDLFSRAKKQRIENVADLFVESVFNPEYGREKLALDASKHRRLRNN